MAFELDQAGQDALKTTITARIGDLEAQYAQVKVRVDAPALGEPEGGSEADQAALSQLENSITTLRDQLDALDNPTPAVGNGKKP